jgi:hypothetical protein
LDAERLSVPSNVNRSASPRLSSAVRSRDGWSRWWVRPDHLLMVSDMTTAELPAATGVPTNSPVEGGAATTFTQFHTLSVDNPARLAEVRAERDPEIDRAGEPEPMATQP